MDYLPIEQYGLIGDLHTAALVGQNGSIDWLCLPTFDSPSVFAAILDHAKGGRFRIAPADDEVSGKQFYWPETNVLVTRFLAASGAVELVDFMPLGEAQVEKRHHEIIRQVHAVRGEVAMRMECRPAFNYARDPHETHLLSGGAHFHSASASLGLATGVPLELLADGVTARFTLREGESAVFVLRKVTPGEEGDVLSTDQAEVAFRQTVEFWRAWMARCKYQGRWREIVHRSLLCLKLLTFEPTGAIVAAPTASLPEGIGGVRNWDYRYTWIRDSAFTIYALLRVGYHEEATRYMQFLKSLSMEGGPGPGGLLQIMYGIDGRRTLTEETLDHLEGYRGSRPVRVGNAAYGQLQIDIYGELLDSIYLYDKHGVPISYELWLTVRTLADWVAANWDMPDEGIWESRGGRRHYVYSRLMCWVALDRAVRLARKRSLPADVAGWARTRDAIFEQIMTRGWSEVQRAFVQSYGSESLDAANLMMSLTLFLSPMDPRLLGTLEATMRPPHAGGLLSNSLVFRYDAALGTDGLHGDEGTFNMCTFWLVEALTRAGRYDRKRLDQARLMFERMLGFANHLGLYAEETGARGEALGNFPQAFTHLALVSAAFNLDRALSG
ncbi:MAG TPA: glycoside hydrolase family 15 protein [Kofleriaceae bacterium]|nr:glycoside hydrolase family 15 protein [Kofleriaceae bacterium]